MASASESKKDVSESDLVWELSLLLAVQSFRSPKVLGNRGLSGPLALLQQLNSPSTQEASNRMITVPRTSRLLPVLYIGTQNHSAMQSHFLIEPIQSILSQNSMTCSN
jgi:hypothetical protein